VNKAGVASKAVAIRKLAIGNIMLTIKDKLASKRQLAQDL
jgi:hypothetical protein